VSSRPTEPTFQPDPGSDTPSNSKTDPGIESCEEPSDTIIPLAARGVKVVLDDEGMRIETRRGRIRGRRVRYGDITHFASLPSGFWLGTRSRIMALRRGRFHDRDDADRLAREISRKIAQQPHGLGRLARNSHINNLASHSQPQRAARWVTLLCVAIYLLQLEDPFVQQVGALIPRLVDEGQLWRLVTANFLHGVSPIPVHLVFNILGLLVLASLVERPLGTPRTIVILGLSGLTAMGVSYATRSVGVVGASGMVMGLAGAAVALEFHFSDRLPTWWRIPRTPFVLILLFEFVKDYFAPGIAGEAHLGGFVGGYLATLLLARPALMGTPARGSMRRLAWGFTALGAICFMIAAPLLLRSPRALERYAWQLLGTMDLGAGSDNDLAWRMATETSASYDQLEPALELAERAVDLTDRSDPDILDTLAEVLFARGDVAGALQAIDEAIGLTRGEDYYVEQRLRFTGERARDDRPPAPLIPWPLRERLLEQEEFEEPGIVI